MYRTNNLPVTPNEFNVLSLDEVSQIVIDVNAGTCELTGKAPSQIPEFMKKAAVYLAEKHQRRRYKEKMYRAQKKEYFSS